MQSLKSAQVNEPEFRPLAVRVKEACRLTGIGRSKLYELMRAGEIGTFKVGAMTLIAMTELERFVAAQSNICENTD
jgi:excisionase family DNA binding protein